MGAGAEHRITSHRQNSILRSERRKEYQHNIQIFELLFLNWSNRNRSFMLLKDITMSKDNSQRKDNMVVRRSWRIECNTGVEGTQYISILIVRVSE